MLRIKMSNSFQKKKKKKPSPDVEVKTSGDVAETHRVAPLRREKRMGFLGTKNKKTPECNLKVSRDSDLNVIFLE